MVQYFLALQESSSMSNPIVYSEIAFIMIFATNRLRAVLLRVLRWFTHECTVNKRLGEKKKNSNQAEPCRVGKSLKRYL